jgi:two-component system response regulator AlgR
MMPRIYIVDDEAPARQRLAVLLEDIRPDCPCELVGEADNAQTALDGVAALQPDIVLLDVQMPGMTGLELARLMTRGNQDEPAPAIIFVTAYDQYALNAFEVHALDYLMKPVRGSRLAEAITRVCSLRAGVQRQALAATVEAAPARRQTFSVLERGRVLLVPVDSVLYLKAEQKYVSLHTHERSYLLEESLVSIEEELADILVRVHRNTLIARKAIAGVERLNRALQVLSSSAEADSEHEKGGDAWQVIVRETGERLPVSRRQWPAIKALVR